MGLGPQVLALYQQLKRLGAFEGISSVEKGVYTLSADSVQAGTGDPAQGSWVTVRRNTDGSFGEAARTS